MDVTGGSGARTLSLALSHRNQHSPSRTLWVKEGGEREREIGDPAHSVVAGEGVRAVCQRWGGGSNQAGEGLDGSSHRRLRGKVLVPRRQRVLFGVQGLGCRVKCARCGVRGEGCGVWGSGVGCSTLEYTKMNRDIWNWY